MDFGLIPETIYAHRNRARFVLGEIDRHQASLGHPVSVLDIGCGTGDLITVWVARLGAEVLGIDTHKPSIQAARGRYALPNLQFEVAAAEDLLSRGKTYDVIICSEVLEHLHEPQSLLVNSRKLICSDGLLIVTIPNGWGPKENEERLVDAYRKIKLLLKRHSTGNRSDASQDLLQVRDVGMIDSLNSECGHVQFFTMRAITRLAQQAGFRIEKQENRRFLSGPISGMLLGQCQRFIEWNVCIAHVIPYWLASSWMFVFRPTVGRVN